MISKTIKVMPWGKGQGDFVEIDAADFDPAKFKLYEPTPAPTEVPKGGKAAKPDATPAPTAAPKA